MHVTVADLPLPSFRMLASAARCMAFGIRLGHPTPSLTRFQTEAHIRSNGSVVAHKGPKTHGCGCGRGMVRTARRQIRRRSFASSCSALQHVATTHEGVLASKDPRERELKLLGRRTGGRERKRRRTCDGTTCSPASPCRSACQLRARSNSSAHRTSSRLQMRSFPWNMVREARGCP